jgi:hypothetical protein
MAFVEPALHMVHRYRSPRAGLIQLVVALRRADLTLRFTDYKNVVVDEAILTGAFPYIARPGRVMAVLVLEGHLEIDSGKKGARPLVVAAGQAVLLPVMAMPQTRWTNTRHVDLEWEPAAGVALTAKRLNVVDVDDLVEARGIAIRNLPTTLRQSLLRFSGPPRGTRARTRRMGRLPPTSSSSPPLRFAPVLRATTTRMAATAKPVG